MSEAGAEVPISQPEPSKTEGRLPKFGRRTFLKGAAVVVGAAIGIGGVKGKEVVNKIIEKSDEGDKTFEINGVLGTYEIFSPREKENFDQTKAVVYLTGWPWSANEEPTKEFPRRLAQNFGFRCFNIDTKTPVENPEYLAKQAQATLEFLKQNGIKEATFVGHSAGAIKAAYLETVAQNDPDFKVKGVVIANTRGLDKIGIGDLFERYKKDASSVGKEFRKKLRKTDIPDPPEQVIQSDLRASILRNIKEYGWGYIPLLLEQAKTLTQIDPIFSKVKAPVLLLVSEKDLVPEYRRYMPDEGVEKHLEPESSDQTLEQQAEVKSKGDEGFFRKYLNALKRRINMARWSRGREKFLEKEVFKSAEKVKVLRSERIGDHNAVFAPRAEQSAHIISRIFDRMRRSSKS